MLRFNVRTDVNQKLSHKLKQISGEVECVLAIQIQKDTSPFVPASQSEVLNRRTAVIGHTVVYPGPYARFLYYGKLMVDPNTGSAWAKKDAVKIPTDKDLKFSQAVHPRAGSHWFEVSKSQNLNKWLRVAKKAVKNEL